MKFVAKQTTLVRELDFMRSVLPRAAAAIGWLEVFCDDQTVGLRASSTSALQQSDGIAQLTERIRPTHVTVSPRAFDQIIRALPDEELQFERVPKGLHIKWSTGSCRIQETLVQMPNFRFEAKSRIEIKREALGSVLRKCKFAYPAFGDTRFPGLLFEVGQQLRVVSIEGAAMAVIEQDLQSPYPGTFVLPVSSTDLVASLVRENRSDPVIFEFSDKHLRMRCGYRTCISSSAYGQFPAWERIILADTPIRADFPVEIAADALRRAMFTVDFEHKPVRVRLRKGEIEFATDIAKEAFAADYDLDPYEFTFKGKLLAGILGAIDTPRVEFLAASQTQQVMFRPLGGSRDRFVLMPLRDRQ